MYEKFLFERIDGEWFLLGKSFTLKEGIHNVKVIVESEYHLIGDVIMINAIYSDKNNINKEGEKEKNVIEGKVFTGKIENSFKIYVVDEKTISFKVKVKRMHSYDNDPYKAKITIVIVNN